MGYIITMIIKKHIAIVSLQSICTEVSSMYLRLVGRSQKVSPFEESPHSTEHGIG